MKIFLKGHRGLIFLPVLRQLTTNRCHLKDSSVVIGQPVCKRKATALTCWSCSKTIDPYTYHRHADVLQHAAIYKTNPKAFPQSIRRKVHICFKFMYAFSAILFVAIRESG
jgi:hypothetical protein